MELVTVIGWLATGASTLSFSPQAWKIIRTCRTKDISTGMKLLPRRRREAVADVLAPPKAGTEFRARGH